MAQHGAWLVSDVGHDVRCQMWGVDVGRVGSTALQGRAPQSLQLGLNGAGCWVSSDGPPSKRRGGARQGMWGACLPLRSRGNTCAPAPARPSPLACPYALAATRAPLYLHAHPHLLAPTRSQQHVRPCTCTPIPTCLRERRAPTCLSIAHARSSPRARAPRHAQVTFMNAQGDIVNRKREYVHYGCRGDWWVALIGGGCSSCANSCAPSGSLVAWS